MSIYFYRQKQWSGIQKLYRWVLGGVTLKCSMRMKIWRYCEGVSRRRNLLWFHSLCAPNASVAPSSVILILQQILQRNKSRIVVLTVQRQMGSVMGSGARSVGSRPYDGSGNDGNGDVRYVFAFFYHPLHYRQMDHQIVFLQQRKRP